MADKAQKHMSPADTPPTSPTDFDYPKPIQRRVHIDDNGVHDFDFGRRQSSPAPKKLQKFSRRSVGGNGQRSISSMTEINHNRQQSSDGSDSASIRKRLSSFLPSGNTLHKSNSGKSQTSVEVQEDPLPDTKKELEIRLNYHLSELDLLKRTIQAANDVIRQQRERFEILQTRSTADMKYAMLKQEQMIGIARKNRDSYVDFVAFHRRQLERIKYRRIEIETDAGLQPTLPEVYKQMWGDEEWGRLFVP
ncbi:hypothetical protein LTR70_003654 [Exophiala xenobiotica]|uniref:Uncharacterized protein n=1 Tax=Lithohypha guttulata TaxID=1690604 RepID=A0ABR0KGM0_9EURO|nr:hypothetical protein LTR24_003155 [Lithohypha guttulata]KAK5322867.1 hypothetical protein LTR70_003654 [Exophiala xenobiotica]